MIRKALEKSPSSKSAAAEIAHCRGFAGHFPNPHGVAGRALLTRAILAEGSLGDLRARETRAEGSSGTAPTRETRRTIGDSFKVE